MIRVLVVDDSAVMRGIMTRIINSQSDMVVSAVANDPLVALERLRGAPPDVITLDVEMPRMDGLEFLSRLMQWRPVPVVMVSSLTERGADTTLRALELGAVDFIAKPHLAASADLDNYAEEVAQKVRAAAGAVLRRQPKPPAPRAIPAGTKPADKVIVIGASTGGVEAIREILTALPAAMPPILIAQHMPEGFTRSFAQRLDTLCALDVKEADDREPIAAGRAYIAPGGIHLELAARGSRLETRLSHEAPVNRHRPSVDTLFRSTARTARGRCIGVMLSGMGADGAQAMRELRESGAHNIAQDEASCVVFGMPKQAIAEGGVHEVLPLAEIPRRLIELSLAKG